MKFHHIGFKVDNLKQSIILYKNLGYKLENEVVIDNTQFIKIAFMIEEESGNRIELIEPMNNNSSIRSFQPGYLHICFELNGDINFFKSFNKNKMGKVFSKKIIAPALNNKEVVFACLQNKEFIELIL